MMGVSEMPFAYGRLTEMPFASRRFRGWLLCLLQSDSRWAWRGSQKSANAFIMLMTIVWRMGLTIMDWILWKGDVRYFIWKKMGILTQAIPLVDRNSVAWFLVVYDRKVKGTGDVCIGVRKANPLAERQETFCFRVRRRLLGWSNDMSWSLTMWIRFLQNWMIFQPIALVDSVVIFVRRMTSKEIDKKISILECGRMFA